MVVFLLLLPFFGSLMKAPVLFLLISYSCGKVLDQLGVEHNLYRRWPGRPA